MCKIEYELLWNLQIDFSAAISCLDCGLHFEWYYNNSQKNRTQPTWCIRTSVRRNNGIISNIAFSQRCSWLCTACAMLAREMCSAFYNIYNVHYIELVECKEGKYMTRGELIEYIVCSFQQRNSAVIIFTQRMCYTRKSSIWILIRVAVPIYLPKYIEFSWMFYGFYITSDFDIFGVLIFWLFNVYSVHTQTKWTVVEFGFLCLCLSKIEPGSERNDTFESVWYLAVGWASSYMRKSFFFFCVCVRCDAFIPKTFYFCSSLYYSITTKYRFRWQGGVFYFQRVWFLCLLVRCLMMLDVWGRHWENQVDV